MRQELWSVLFQLHFPAYAKPVHSEENCNWQSHCAEEARVQCAQHYRLEFLDKRYGYDQRAPL